MPFFLRQAGGNSHTQGCGDGVGGMTTGKRVIFALHRSGERTDTMKTTVGVELVTTTGQNLVTVGLVPYIPDNTVFRGVVNVVQRHSDLYNAKTGG